MLEAIPVVVEPVVWILEPGILETLELDTLAVLDPPVDTDELGMGDLEIVELELLPVLGLGVDTVDFEDPILALCEAVVRLDDEALLELPELDPPGTDEREFVNEPAELELRGAVDMLVSEALILALVESGLAVEEALADKND